jgi:two-component sensor histidine kinase
MPVTIIQKLLAHQKALAEFGSFAFRAVDLQTVLDKAAEVCAVSLETPFCKVCAYRPAEDDLLITAGYGWQPDVIGYAISKADMSSPGGRAFITRQPVIACDLKAESEYVLPPFYAQHQIISTVNVVIQGTNGDLPYGILEIDSPLARDYDEHDISFLTGFANVLAEFVATMRRTERLRVALAEKEVLSRELQHRVRNNLHLIYAMLNMEIESLNDTVPSFRAIANRVQALATVYDHLLGTGMARSLAFDQYLIKLCDTLRSVQTSQIALIDRILAPATVDLDTATAMGLAVTELITNAYKHAFPDGKGTIEVVLDKHEQGPLLTVQDDGVGIDTSDTSKLSRRNGIGLVQRLAEQVDAAIEIRRLERGTRCDIRLPQLAIAN